MRVFRETHAETLLELDPQGRAAPGCSLGCNGHARLNSRAAYLILRLGYGLVWLIQWRGAEKSAPHEHTKYAEAACKSPEARAKE